MKNMRISTKLNVILSVVLFIGLGIICIVAYSNMSKAMTEAAYTRMEESTEARCAIVENYIANAEEFLRAYSQGTEVSETLMNPSEANIERLREYTKRLAKVNAKLENIYACDEISTQLAGMVDVMQGKQLREGEKLKALTDNLYTGKDVYNIGVLTSPSTGAQVLSMYYPIYDAGNKPVGFTGMALQANELLDTLNELKFIGLNGCTYYLIDVKNAKYISCNDAEKNGTEIEDENILAITTNTANMTGEDYSIAKTTYIEGATGSKKMAVYKFLPDRNWMFVVEVSQSELMDGTVKLATTLIVISILILAASVFIVFMLSHFTLTPIKKMSDTLTSISLLDMTQGQSLHKYLDRKDEAGMIANATYHLTDELTKIVTELRSESKLLLDTSVNLMKIFSENVNSIGQVENAIQDIASSSGNQAEETQNASEQVLTIGNMVDQLTKETGNLLENSSIMNDIGNKATESLTHLQLLNGNTEKSVKVIYQQTTNTNSSVEKIRDAVSIITAIAEETSLLSLNASIEAARAGEQGRGFAVVATQIKTLAEQSNGSAKDINDVISSLIKDSQDAVQTMEEVQENFKLQSSHVEETSVVFEQLKERINQSINWIGKISGQTETMHQARIKVVDAVSGLSAIAEENAASTEETSASVSLVADSMQSIQNSAAMLEDMAHKLEENISKFVL